MNPVTTPLAAADRLLARSMLVIALFAAVAGAARVLQDAAVAWRHGTGPLVDAYYFAVSLTSWPGAVALATLTMLVVPRDAALRQRHGDAGARRLRAELLGGVLLAAAAALPLAWWVLPAVVAGRLGALEPAAAAWAVAGMPALVWLVPLGLVGALLSAWLVAAGQRLLTLLESLPALLLTAALLWVPGSVLFWGTAAGLALQVLAMAALLRAVQALPAPRLGSLSGAWRGMGYGALMLLAGQVLFSLTSLIDPFFAARLGDGAVATISYAGRLVLGLQGLLGLAVQRAGLPLLSQLAGSAPAQARRVAWRWAGWAALAGALVAAAVAASADVLVALLFERGQFTPDDRAQVVWLLRWGMLQLPPFLAGLVLVTALAAARRARWLAAIAAAGFGAKLLLSALLAAPYGTAGLMLATALMYATTSMLAGLALLSWTEDRVEG